MVMMIDNKMMIKFAVVVVDHLFVVKMNFDMMMLMVVVIVNH
jgi:hypothetical protein